MTARDEQTATIATDDQAARPDVTCARRRIGLDDDVVAVGDALDAIESAVVRLLVAGSARDCSGPPVVVTCSPWRPPRPMIAR